VESESGESGDGDGSDEDGNETSDYEAWGDKKRQRKS
jgi:hypothetical protein